VLVVSFVRQINQSFVEEFLAHAALRSAAKDDGFSLGIKSKGEPPLNLSFSSSVVSTCALSG
jgi:hypothetical protein